jgi:hypothetical protein
LTPALDDGDDDDDGAGHFTQGGRHASTLCIGGWMFLRGRAAPPFLTPALDDGHIHVLAILPKGEDTLLPFV